MRGLVVALSLAGLTIAGAAQAHTHLLASSPADKAVVAAAPKVELHFSEGLEAHFSSAKLSRGGAAVDAPSQVVGKDRKTLVATPKAPLGPGAYTVDWQVLSADGHKMTGAYGFIVK